MLAVLFYDITNPWMGILGLPRKTTPITSNGLTSLETTYKETEKRMYESLKLSLDRRILYAKSFKDSRLHHRRDFHSLHVPGNATDELTESLFRNGFPRNLPPCAAVDHQDVLAGCCYSCDQV